MGTSMVLTSGGQRAERQTNREHALYAGRWVGLLEGVCVVGCVCVTMLFYLIKVGPFVRLSNGEERSYCLDMEPPTHAFVPCGHMCSENTAK